MLGILPQLEDLGNTWVRRASMQTMRQTGGYQSPRKGLVPYRIQILKGRTMKDEQIIFEWECIDEESGTYRAAVLGGWIVRHDQEVVPTEIAGFRSFRSSMVFVPDPGLNWVI